MKIAVAIASCALGCVPLVTHIDAWWQQWAGAGHRSEGGLAALLGETRRLFAGHFFIKADVYFHRGYYPSMFDEQSAYQSPHMAADAGAMEDHNEGDEHAFLGESRDWIERFGRHFYPSEHTHLDHHEEGEDTEVQEILPWIRMTTALDPNQVTAYVTGAFWLRQSSNRVEEAEQFLREGWRANPESHEIIFELGRLAKESRNDIPTARRLWELALKKWEQNEGRLPEPDVYFFRALIIHLGDLELNEGRLERALALYTYGEQRGGEPGLFQRQLAEINARISEKSATSQP